MASYAVKLPLAQDSADGYAMIKRLKTLVKQNLKMLILTNPGERVMEPDYGVGIRQFLFENFGRNISLISFHQNIKRVNETIKEVVDIENAFW